MINKNIFGTDGVRGRANEGYITPENAMKLAISAVNYYIESGHKSVNGKFTVVIGKDTRLSGYMLESALTSGFIAAGADVRLLGPIPTPAVSVITRSMRADLGVVISASHNPYYDNGIKFFNSKGLKISGADEIGISSIFHKGGCLVSPDHMGKAKRIVDAAGRYVEFVKSSFPKELTLSGVKIVIDTSNGAAYKVAPEIFWELGADIITVGDDPDGLNINKGCGATDTELLRKTVLKHSADIGFALDGDADRLIVVDNKGNVLDGDYILAAIATDWKSSDKLYGNNVVATTMSNMGLEKYLNGIGVNLVRCEVGDKFVVQKMLEIGSKLGGEKSGHIIPADYATTGDGLVSSLQILSFLLRNNMRASDIKSLYEPFPQVFKNIEKSIDVNSESVKNIVFHIQNEILNGNGRIVIRKSGTENLTRIMIESKDPTEINRALEVVDSMIL